MNKMAMSWSKYQELLAQGRVSPPVHTDDNGIVWEVDVQSSTFEVKPPTPEQKARTAAFMAQFFQQ